MLRRIVCVTISLGLLAPLAWAAPPSHTIAVDCEHGETIRQALKHPAQQLVIEISGFCQERVVITRSNVTLIGSDPATDGITGPAVDDPVVQRALVRVIDARNVRFENLAISGSESRGLEGQDPAAVDIVNCRVTDNGFRAIQANNGASINVVDSVIADNGNVALITFSGGLITCTRCTVDHNGGILAVAVRGSVIQFDDSSLSTSGTVGVLSAERGSVYGSDTDVSAGLVPLYASEDAQLSWTGGAVEGSIWADFTSQLFLTGVTQTANPVQNRVSEASHLAITGGSYLGDTLLTGFSNGTAEGSPTFDTISCDRGGNLFCDGSETKTASACGLCP